VTAAAVDGRRAESSRSLLLPGLAVFATLAPIYKGANRPLPLMALELAALALLFALFVTRDGSRASPLAVDGAARRATTTFPASLAIGLGILLVFPLLQLVPLPAGWWSALPGHEPYAQIVERFGDPSAHAWRAVSLQPAQTLASWLALLPPLACLLGMMRLSPSNATRLLVWLAVVAGGEAVLGLMQAGIGDMFSFAERDPNAPNRATGTFVNRNHLAAMLAMVLPVIIALLIRRVRPGHLARRAPAVGEGAAQVALLAGAALVVVVSLVLTRSRAGIATAGIGIALLFVAVVVARAPTADRGGRAAWIVAAIVAAGGAAAVAIIAATGTPFTSRMTTETVSLDLQTRVAMYTSTLRAALDFLPFGSGLGTFAAVYPPFQPVTGRVAVGGFVNHAHNDYLEALLEIGIAAPLVGLLFARAWLGRMWSLLRHDDGRGFTLLQIGAGVGLVPAALHSVLDFPLHMPSNAMWFGLLAGVFFHARASERVVAGEERARAAFPQRA